MSKIKKLKEELKAEAKAISHNRRASRFNQSHEARNLPDRRDYVSYDNPDYRWNVSWTYRHRHIAYCLLRGRSYEQIEPKVNQGNEPDWDLINRIKEVYSEPATEALCDRAV